MCKEIEKRSGGYFTLKHSTLYPLLHRLEHEGLVRSHWAEFEGGKPRRYYELTAAGADVVAPSAQAGNYSDTVISQTPLLSFLRKRCKPYKFF